MSYYSYLIWLAAALIFQSSLWAQDEDQPPLLEISSSGLPIKVDDHVNDFAGALSKNQDNRLFTILSALKKSTSRDIKVLTLESFSEFEGSFSNPDDFGKAIYKDWEVGHRRNKDGVLILFLEDMGKVYITLGKGFPSYYRKVVDRIIERKFETAFAKANYGQGILVGTQAIADKVRKKVSCFNNKNGLLLLEFLFS